MNKQETLTAMLAVQEKEVPSLFLPEVYPAPFVNGRFSIATEQTIQKYPRLWVNYDKIWVPVVKKMKLDQVLILLIQKREYKQDEKE